MLTTTTGSYKSSLWLTGATFLRGAHACRLAPDNVDEIKPTAVIMERELKLASWDGQERLFSFSPDTVTKEGDLLRSRLTSRGLFCGDWLAHAAANT